MPVPHIPRKEFSKPSDIEKEKQYKEHETFRGISVSYVKVVHLDLLTNVPNKYQLPASYDF